MLIFRVEYCFLCLVEELKLNPKLKDSVFKYPFDFMLIFRKCVSRVEYCFLQLVEEFR